MDAAKLREASIPWAEAAARKLMEGKHRRCLAEPELIALLAVAYEAGAVTSDAAHKTKKHKG